MADVEAWSSEWRHAPQPRHSHDFFQISLTRSGTGQVRRTGQMATCPVNHFVAFHPDEVHELQPDGNDVWVFDTLYLPVNRVAEVVEGLTGSSPRQQLSPMPFHDAELKARFRQLHHAVVHGDERLAQDDRLLNFLKRLALHQSRLSDLPRLRSHTKGIERVRDYLESRIEQSVSLSDLAAIAGIGSFHLTRLFRERYGLPPHAYHIQARVRHARQMLKVGVPVVDVAARAGFADQSHLTRLFKKLVGVTPGDFRLRSRSFKTDDAVDALMARDQFH